MKLIKLSLLHHDDWSSSIPNNVQTWTIKSIPIENKDLINALVLIKAPNAYIVKETLHIIKQNRRIKNIKILDDTVTRSYAAALLYISSSYKGSITEVMANSSIVFAEYVRNNKEYWSVLINGKAIENNLIQDINERAEVISYYSFDIKNVLKNFYSKYTLTDKEFRILKTAYEHGYFEWPKHKNADEISKYLGISKVTFIQELRRALRKLVLKELDFNDIYFMGPY